MQTPRETDQLSHTQGTLIFMTDPICSWCWGTLPEIQKLQERFAGRLDFQLKCAGLQVGSRKPLTEQKSNELIALWQQVAETTGQSFAFKLPADATFIYHSELACRTLQIARTHLQTEPWQVFTAIQHAFYRQCLNISDPEILFGFLEPYGMSYEAFAQALISDAVVRSTRREFDWCSAQGISALPTLFLDLGDGPKLLCGGYATAEYLIGDISARLSSH